MENTKTDDDELYFLDLIKLFLKNKKTICTIIGVSMTLSLFYNILVPKTYLTTATFFIPPNESTSSSLFSGYAKFLGTDKGSITLNSIIIEILKSKRIKNNIKNHINTSFKFNYSKATIHKYLNLTKQTQVNQNTSNLFKLHYEHRNPNISFEVVKKYLSELEQTNKDINIIPQKKFIIVLDSPQLPKNKYRPKRALNLILTLIFSSILSILFILGKNMLQDLMKELKKHNRST